MTEQLTIAFSVISFLIIILGLIVTKLQKRFLTEPLVAMMVGILVSPYALNILDMDMWGKKEEIMNLATQFTIAMAVMASALRIPKSYPVKDKKYQAFALLIIMPLMALTSGFLIYWITGMSFLLAFLIGAVLTPTDPVISSTIVSGGIAEQNLSAKVRDAISFESGANDGLAFPIVMIFALFMEHSAGEAMNEWFFKTLLYENIAAIAIGLMIGWLSGKLLHHSHKNGWMNTQTLLPFSLAITFFTLMFENFLNMNGIIGTFAAGIMLNEAIDSKEDLQQERVQETMERLFTIPVFVLFGLIIPWKEWFELGWKAFAIVAAILLFRRLPWFMLLQPVMPNLKKRADAWMTGWFGPIGVAAMFYAFYTMQKTGHHEIWEITSLLVFFSTLIHGITSYPFTRYYGKRFKESQ